MLEFIDKLTQWLWTVCHKATISFCFGNNTLHLYDCPHFPELNNIIVLKFQSRRRQTPVWQTEIILSLSQCLSLTWPLNKVYWCGRICLLLLDPVDAPGQSTQTVNRFTMVEEITSQCSCSVGKGPLCVCVCFRRCVSCLLTDLKKLWPDLLK